ncbi:hypothetical protein [Shewanella algae]
MRRLLLHRSQGGNSPACWAMTHIAIT